MRKSGLIATAALIAGALPLMAVSASAQNKLDMMRGGGRGAVAGPAVKGGAGPGAFRSGGGVAFQGGAVAAAPRAGWSGPRPGWNGPRYGGGYGGGYGRSYVAPGIGIGLGTGLLLGGALAAQQPYYYGSGYSSGYGVPYGYEEPYDDRYIYAAPAQGASSDDVAYCQQRYRSYDMRSGTYLNNDGNRYPCP